MQQEKKYESDARATPPSFGEMVEMIKKLFTDYLEDVIKAKPSEITESWERYKTLNHLFQEEQPNKAAIGVSEDGDQLQFSLERGDLWKTRALAAELALEERKCAEWVKAEWGMVPDGIHSMKLVSKDNVVMRGTGLVANNAISIITFLNKTTMGENELPENYEGVYYLDESEKSKGDQSLPDDVVEKILKVRDYISIGEYNEAYHHLYSIAQPKFDSFFPWKVFEEQVGYVKSNEKQLIENKESKEGNKEREEKDFADWIAKEGHYKNDGKWYTFYGVIIAESTAELWNEWDNQQNRNK
jgi:hypothetical protein